MYPTTVVGRFIGVTVFYCGIILLALPITVIGGNFTVFYHEWVDDAKLEEDIRATLLADRRALDSPAVTRKEDGMGGMGSRIAVPNPAVADEDALALSLPPRLTFQTDEVDEKSAKADRATANNGRSQGSAGDTGAGAVGCGGGGGNGSDRERALGALGSIMTAAGVGNTTNSSTVV